MTAADQRTVLVTGASGFVGAFLVPHLASHGWRVRAAARHWSTIAAGPAIEPVAMPDLAQPVDWRPLVAGVSHIVHLAGLAHATSQIPEAAYMAVNADATRQLAIAARAAGVQRMVLLSSVKAQSDAVAAHVLNENDPPRPVDAYGRSKLAAERSMAEVLAGSRTEWTVLRPVLVHGPGVKGNMRTLFKLARLPLPLPLKALTNRRSILSLANLAGAIEHALTSPVTHARTFLVADPDPVTIPEILAALRLGLGRKPRILRIPLAPAALAARLIGKTAAWSRVAGDLVVDTSALQATGWRPVQTSREALQRVLAAKERHRA